jgi:hypothetical protein
MRSFRRVQVHVAAVDVDTVTVQQVAYRGGVLAQQRQRRLGPGSDLAHPVEHAVAQPRRSGGDCGRNTTPVVMSCTPPPQHTGGRAGQRLTV